MELKNPLLAVADMERSVAFYGRVLGLQVILASGMTPEQAAERMDVPLEYVQECMG